MSFKPKKILDNMQNVETTVNEYFAYKLQSRIFNRIESKDKKIDDKFDEICNDGDEFKRAVLEDNARFYRKSQILGVFNYREDLKEQCNILINMTLNSNVKLFPECERKTREIVHFYQSPQIIKENANESKS